MSWNRPCFWWRSKSVQRLRQPWKLPWLLAGRITSHRQRLSFGRYPGLRTFLLSLFPLHRQSVPLTVTPLNCLWRWFNWDILYWDFNSLTKRWAREWISNNNLPFVDKELSNCVLNQLSVRFRIGQKHGKSQKTHVPHIHSAKCPWKQFRSLQGLITELDVRNGLLLCGPANIFWFPNVNCIHFDDITPVQKKIDVNEGTL